MISTEQIAHDLAMVYVVNRHRAEVTGQFDVQTSGDREVTGDGHVETERLPDVDATRTVQVGTGERYFFGLFERTRGVNTGEYHVDPVFREMADDYRKAHARFLELLSDGSTS